MSSMTQLVIGTALGFAVAQGAFYGARHLVGWLRRDEVRARIRTLTPAPGPAMVSGFIKYAAPLGASAAIITLSAWAVSDYLATKSGSAAAANALEPAPAPPQATGEGTAEKVADVEPPAKADTPAAGTSPADDADPYSDSDFKVHRRAHRTMSLKDTLVLRSEAKARDELLLETQQHANRSQYDCEAANRADRYLKAGLDVWGFGAWQVKHFPSDGYRGATLPQCKSIKDVVAESSPLDLQSTVAQRNH